MKYYNEKFMTKTDDMCVSVRQLENNTIQLGIDVGVDGFYAELTNKEIDKLIGMLKEARKVRNKSEV